MLYKCSLRCVSGILRGETMNATKDSKKTRRRIFEYAVICAMAIGFALMYQIFVIPNKFAPAGINGIATMVQYKLGFSIGYFSLIINIPLCIYAYFRVNKEFAVKSLLFCLIYSGSYLVLQQLDLSAIQYDAEGVDTIFPCLIAGLIGGCVYGCCVRVNASTGGTDIISKGISMKKPVLNFFWITFAMNAVVAFVSLFVYSDGGAGGVFRLDYRPVCLCVLYCFISSFLGNRILQGYKVAYKFTITTARAHSEAIEEDILHNLRHSATRISGKGIYSEDDKEILICVVNKHQIADFKRLLSKYPDTFTFVETVNETVGNFKKVK